MLSDDGEAAFRLAVSERMSSLRRTAFGFCGDWSAADDLVQTTLVKLVTAWPLREPGALDGWLRLTMTRAYVDTLRRPWWRRERSYATLPDRPGPAETGSAAGDLAPELARLPPRQRACLVLRFLDDCSVEQTAEALGCTTGTVKSTTSRALASLRVQLRETNALGEGRPS